MPRISGDRGRFALCFDLLDDPDPGPLLLRKSWGALQIWVAGRNLTLGMTTAQDTVSAAEIPLLPIVEWLAAKWDPLLHEERLPRPCKTLTAASWRLDVLAHLPTNPAQLDLLLNTREDFWRRHGLGSALTEFRIPDLHLRRRGDGIELSWDDREWRTVSSGVLLAERPGHALLPAEEVAEVLIHFAEALLDALAVDPAAEPAAAGHLAELRAKFASHRSADRHIDRLRWMAGVEIDAAARRLRTMAGITDGALQDTVRALLGLDAPHAPTLVTQATVPVLLFRSAAPNLSADDLNVLVRLAQESRGTTSSPFDAFRVVLLAADQLPAPLPGSESSITADGLERAVQVREQMHYPADTPLTAEHDLELVLLPALGIRVMVINLDDRGVDGIAIAGPDIAPIIAINRSGRRAGTPWGRRMTLAHELCHLLFDADKAGRVGVVSNSWADMGVERRANAFAVNFLAPEPAILACLDRDRVESWTRAELEAAMHRLGIGVQTLTWQLKNLGWIDASTQEYWLEAFRSP